MNFSSLPRLMIEPIVRAALLEDLGRASDLTTDAIVPVHARAETALIVRKGGVLTGLDAALLAFELMNAEIGAVAMRKDGDELEPGETIAIVKGPARRAGRVEFSLPP